MDLGGAESQYFLLCGLGHHAVTLTQFCPKRGVEITTKRQLVLRRGLSHTLGMLMLMFLIALRVRVPASELQPSAQEARMGSGCQTHQTPKARLSQAQAGHCFLGAEHSSVESVQPARPSSGVSLTSRPGLD